MAEDFRGIGPTYMSHLADAGVIKDDIFAFFLESYSETNGLDRVSFIDIGEVVDSHMKPGSKVVWFDLVPHMYWKF